MNDRVALSWPVVDEFRWIVRTSPSRVRLRSFFQEAADRGEVTEGMAVGLTVDEHTWVQAVITARATACLAGKRPEVAAAVNAVGDWVAAVRNRPAPANLTIVERNNP